MKDPGAVFLLIAIVQFAIVASAGLPHLPDYFQPAVGQTAQRAGVALPPPAVILVISLCPSALRAAAIGP